MTTSHFAKSRQVQRQLLTLLASTTILTAGCSNMVSTASSSAGANAQAIQIKGRIKGGNQPVSGATVTLYSAGQGPGLPSAATAIATTTSANDGSGSFSFTRAADGGTNTGTTSTFSCPVNPPGSVVAQNGGPYIYVVARGGNTVNDGSSSVNNDAVFIAPYGRCGSIGASTFVSMSEVVTVATVAAIHQYMNPTAALIETSIGADGIYISDLALSNSFNTVSNMVDLSTGLALTSTTHTNNASGVGSVTVTVTPEQAKINHLADILSSCVNNATSGSSACATLYAAAVPSSDLSSTSVPNATAGAATDVLKAAYYISTNPTNGSSSNLQALYNIPAATGSPYMPRLTAQPSDWTIGIDYTSTNICSDVTGSAANFMQNVYDLAIDLNGNIWFANNQAGSGSLAGMSPVGVPSGCYTLPAGTSNNASSTSGAQSTIIDIAGNVWVGSARSNDLYRYTPAPVGSTPTTTSIATSNPVTALTADGYGDVFYANADGIWELVNASTAGTIPVAVKISTMAIGTPARIMIDTNDAIWSTSAGSGAVYKTAGAVQGGTIPSLGAFSTTFQVSFGGVPYGLATTRMYGATEAGGPGVYIGTSQNQLFYFLTSGTVNQYSPNGMNNPAGIALDGSQNVWAANNGTAGLSEITKAGTSLAPNPQGFGKSFNGFSGQQSIIIDASGNVWTGLISPRGNTITEIVGGAVPVYQPYALGLPPQSGTRFQTIP